MTKKKNFEETFGSKQMDLGNTRKELGYLRDQAREVVAFIL